MDYILLDYDKTGFHPGKCEDGEGVGRFNNLDDLHEAVDRYSEDTNDKCLLRYVVINEQGDQVMAEWLD